ncbi:hypothetical protein Q5752_006208 [Cryptotrichosporon argae]
MIADRPRSRLPRFVGRKRTGPRLALVLVLAVVTLVLYRTSALSPAVEVTLAPASSPRCNPYAQPGYLHVPPPGHPHEHRWTTFGAGCPTPALLRALLAHTRPERHPWKRGERALEDVEFVRGRTVAVFGDSLQRNSVRQFCTHNEGIFSQVNASHPLMTGAGPWVAPELDIRLTKGTQAHFTHYCYVPQFDFAVVFFFFFGLDQDEYWINQERGNPPYAFEDRVVEIARPVLGALERARGRGATPDLAMFASAMWDLQHFTNDNIDAGKDVAAQLDYDHVVWYRRRTREALLYLARTFPGSPLRYITNHYPLRTATGWKRNGVVPEVRLGRVEPLHQAGLSAVRDLADATPDEAEILRRVGINHWGEVLRGMEDHQDDFLHPGPSVGGYLWGDIMLFELREALIRAGEWTPTVAEGQAEM